jgi:hypothetical protein
MGTTFMANQIEKKKSKGFSADLGFSCYIQRMNFTKENILKIALGLLIGIFIGYLIAEYLLPIVRQ